MTEPSEPTESGHAAVTGDAAETPDATERLVAQDPIRLFPLPGIPLVRPGDDLAGMLVQAVRRAGSGLLEHDVLVVAQKVVSKAEGRLVDLRTVVAGPRARRLAAEVGKDERLVEVVLSESRAVVRAAPGVLIVETRLGFVCANAGVDHSNVSSDEQVVALLPSDPDASAADLRSAVASLTGSDVGIVITDSHGRPWREGTVGVAIGTAGIAPVADLRGRNDLFGRVLRATTVGHVDELAAAASLAMGQADEGIPAVLARGLDRQGYTNRGARELQRRRDRDLFR